MTDETLPMFQFSYAPDEYFEYEDVKHDIENRYEEYMRQPGLEDQEVHGLLEQAHFLIEIIESFREAAHHARR